MMQPHTQTHPNRMQISLRAMLGFALPTAIVLWALGAWPAWHWAGGDGLAAHTAAGCIVLGVMVASAALVKLFAALGPDKAAFAFIGASFARILFCVGITIGAWALFDMPTGVLCLSVPAFYVALLIAEGIWLSKALNRDATLVATGKVRCPKSLMPSELRREQAPADRKGTHLT